MPSACVSGTPPNEEHNEEPFEDHEFGKMTPEDMEVRDRKQKFVEKWRAAIPYTPTQADPDAPQTANLPPSQPAEDDTAAQEAAESSKPKSRATSKKGAARSSKRKPASPSKPKPARKQHQPEPEPELRSGPCPIHTTRRKPVAETPYKSPLRRTGSNMKESSEWWSRPAETRARTRAATALLERVQEEEEETPRAGAGLRETEVDADVDVDGDTKMADAESEQPPTTPRRSTRRTANVYSAQPVSPETPTWRGDTVENRQRQSTRDRRSTPYDKTQAPRGRLTKRRSSQQLV